MSENRAEYLELIIAAAKSGAILACQDSRLTVPELNHCLTLVDPALIVVSPRFASKLEEVGSSAVPVMVLGPEWEERLAEWDPVAPRPVDPEDPLLILFTVDETGLPKGAILSHRALLARVSAMFLDMGSRPGSTNLAWPPFYCAAGAAPALSALLTGGRVIVEDDFEADRVADHLARERFDWVSVLPGAVGLLADAIERRGLRPLGVKRFGAMADIVAAEDLLRLTRLLNVPFCDTFGSTETGATPLVGCIVEPDSNGRDFAKTPTALADIRLVDEDSRDVADGETGELIMRGPTLFSGYWADDEATARDFRGGWFHTGDLFRRRVDGKFEFVDRAKHVIKSGSENIYPAEIERVLLSVEGVREAVVVRRKDARWGETPVALVVVGEAGPHEAALRVKCRAMLAGYKQPKAILFVPPERLARAPNGNIPRVQLEQFVANHPSLLWSL